MKYMGKNGGYKQEVILFDLKKWVLARWDKQRRETVEMRLYQQRGNRSLDMGLGFVEEGVQTCFYVSSLLRETLKHFELTDTGSARSSSPPNGLLIGVYSALPESSRDSSSILSFTI
jgi:hypothetical protein